MIRFILIIMLFMCGSAYPESVASLIDKGNEAFDEGELGKALEYYHEAEIERPETPEIYYNQANTLLKSGKYEEAIEKYEKALNTDDIKLQGHAYFNKGNGYFLQSNYESSIEAYENVLEINPEDLDAKYNLELARNRLKEQMERKPQDKDKQCNPDSGQNKQEQQQEQQQEQEREQQQEEMTQQGEEQEKEEEQQQKQGETTQQDGEQDKEEEQQQAEQQPRPDEMSKEDAQRILHALEEDEKENQKKKKKLKVKANYRGKDW